MGLADINALGEVEGNDLGEVDGDALGEEVECDSKGDLESCTLVFLLGLTDGNTLSNGMGKVEGDAIGEVDSFGLKSVPEKTQKPRSYISYVIILLYIRAL